MGFGELERSDYLGYPGLIWLGWSSRVGVVQVKVRFGFMGFIG